MIKVYGIPNCDTVKKAISWLQLHGLEYQFYDFKTYGITAEKLTAWIAHTSIDKVLNKRSTTFKNLDNTLINISDQEEAVKLMIQYTSIIKRPVIEFKGILLQGFKESDYVKLLQR